jgi:hypothetical protein
MVLILKDALHDPGLTGINGTLGRFHFMVSEDF